MRARASVGVEDLPEHLRTFWPSDWPGSSLDARAAAWRAARVSWLQATGRAYDACEALQDAYRQRRAAAFGA